MSIKVPHESVTVFSSLLDKIQWEIPDSTVDPLGYTCEVNDINLTTSAEQDGQNVIVIALIPANTFQVGCFEGFFISNTREADKFEQVGLTVEVKQTADEL